MNLLPKNQASWEIVSFPYCLICGFVIFLDRQSQNRAQKFCFHMQRIPNTSRFGLPPSRFECRAVKHMQRGNQHNHRLLITAGLTPLSVFLRFFIIGFKRKTRETVWVILITGRLLNYSFSINIILLLQD